VSEAERGTTEAFGKGVGEYMASQDTWYVRGIGRPAKVRRPRAHGECTVGP
jgi:hypothetical protein